MDLSTFDEMKSEFMGKYSQLEQILVKLYNYSKCNSSFFTVVFPFEEYPGWLWFNDAFGLITSHVVNGEFTMIIDSSYMEYTHALNVEKDNEPWIDGGSD